MFSPSFRFILLFSLVFSTSLIPLAAQPQHTSLKIPALSDSYVAEDKSNWKAGLEDYLIIGFSKYLSRYDCEIVIDYSYPPNYKIIKCKQIYKVKDKRNILLHFNLSSIPPGSEVVEAILQLHVYTPYDSIPVKIYGLEECFRESEVSWLSRLEGTRWRDAGGTHEETLLDQGTLGKFQKSTGYYRFNVTDYYRRVLKGEAPNCGILITPDPPRYFREEEVVASTNYRGGGAAEAKSYEFLRKEAQYYAKFYSKELTEKRNVPEYTPVLMINFTGPSVSLRAMTESLLTMHPGENTSFRIAVDSTFLGKLEVKSEVLGGDGVTVDVHPLDNGSFFESYVMVGKNAELGEYTLKFSPVPVGYDEEYFSLSGASVKLVVEEKKEVLKDYFLLMPETTKLSVKRGGSTTFSINLIPRGKFWSKVHLSAETPGGLNLSFDPEDGVPPFKTEVTVRASADAPLGDHTLLLMAQGGGYETNLSLGVRVLEGEQAKATSSAPATTKTTRAAGSSTTTKSKTGAATSGIPVTKITTTTETGGEGVNALLVAVPLIVILALITIFLTRRRLH